MRKKIDSGATRLIESISDGLEIDWERELREDPSLASRLEALRLVERVTAAHWSAAGSRAPDTPGPEEAAGSASRPAAANASAPPTTWGHLRLLERIGEGGYGQVYRAYDPRLEIDVALKLWKCDAWDSADDFLTEARRLARMRHPNVLVVHGADQHDGRIGMWTELLVGRTLEDLLREHGPFSPHEATLIGMDLCRALAAVHGAGLIHRDVKTTNVMREHGGRIVLMDFGSVTEAPRAGTPRRDTIIGTPIFMAPEQLRALPLTPATDVYGLGVLLYRMVTARFPIDARSVAELSAKHAREEFVPLRDARPDLPPAFAEVVERALSPRPEARFAGAAAMERALVDSIRATRAEGGEGPRGVAEVADETYATPHNLPPSLTCFIGRERELDECSRLLEKHRVVTLTGPGGSGKTRLALHVAESRLAFSPGGVWFVDLAPVGDAARVEATVAAVLRVREQAGKALESLLLERIGATPMLLVLDNCEHLIGACHALLAALAPACPELHVLATSRERLGFPGECAYAVPSLSVPADETTPAESALDYEAVRLFVERARAAVPEFHLRDRNVRTVVEICRSLDGLPLALELAAARLRVLSVEAIRSRLDERFRLLKAADRALPRHRTLEAAIGWSYELLDEDERRLFRSLSVFVGGCTVEAAARVCGEGNDEFAILDALTGLVDKSLVVVERREGDENRFRFLETIGQYARELLDAAGETAHLRDAHLEYFLALAKEDEQRVGQEAQWLARLEEDHENLQAALSWSHSSEARARLGLRLAAALGRLWNVHGHFTLGRRLLIGLLERPDLRAPVPERALACYGAGRLTLWQGDCDAARLLFEEALAIYRGAGDRHGEMRVLVTLGIAAKGLGDEAGRRSRYEESLSVAREIGDKRGMAVALGNLAVVAADRGDLAAACDLNQQAMELMREVGDKHDLGGMLVNLASHSIRAERFEVARAALGESLRLEQQLGAKRLGLHAIEMSAELAWHLGDAWQAALCLGAADALQRSIASSRLASDQAEHDRQVARTRESLGGERFTSAWEEGQRMSFDSMIERVIGWLERPTASAPGR